MDYQKELIEKIDKSYSAKKKIKMAMEMHQLKNYFTHKNDFIEFAEKRWKYSRGHIGYLLKIGKFCQLLKKENIALPRYYNHISKFIYFIRKDEGVEIMKDLWKDITIKENPKKLTKKKIKKYFEEWEEELVEISEFPKKFEIFQSDNNIQDDSYDLQNEHQKKKRKREEIRMFAILHYKKNDA